MYTLNYKKDFEMKLPIPKFSERYEKILKSEKQDIVYIKEEFDHSTFRYRTYNVIESMENNDKYNVTCFLVEELENIIHLIDKIAIIILQRAKWSFELENFIYLLKKMNKIIIYDMDDMIYHTKYVPKYINSISNYDESTIDSYFALSTRYELIASMCDGFIVTTKTLKKHIEKDFKKPTWIIKNYLNKKQETISKDIVLQKNENYDNTKFIIGYFSGSMSHKRDLEIIEYTIIKLMEKYSNIYLNIVGHMSLSKKLEKFKKEGRIIIDDFVSFEELQYKIGKVDVNIIPLQKHEFNECKSELKYFEASIVNTISCATDNTSYNNIIEDGVDGFLCNELEWYEKLEYIYLNPKKIKNIAQKANKKCYKLYGNNNQENTIVAVYDEIVNIIGSEK